MLLIPKQILQRLPIVLLKAFKTSENLLNEIRHIRFSLFPENKLRKEYRAI